MACLFTIDHQPAQCTGTITRLIAVAHLIERVGLLASKYNLLSDSRTCKALERGKRQCYL